MTDSQPKFKFKKRNKASLKKKQLRRTSDDDAVTSTSTTVTVDRVKTEDVASGSTSSAVKMEDGNSTSSTHVIPHRDDDDEEGEDPSALSKILAVERRRRILGAGRNRGVDAANLGKNIKHTKRVTTSVKEESESVEALTRKEERLKVSFAGGKLAGSNDMGGDDEGGILAKKHRRAMEEFIQSNLSAQEGGGAVSGKNGSIEGEEKNNASEAEKEMYAELLTSDTAKGDAANDAPNDTGEGDVGAGGAMMGGTGIAEVALPIDERIKALKETERAAMEYERARKEARLGNMKGEEPVSGVAEEGNATFLGVSNESNNSSIAEMVPMNFASGPGKRKRQEEVSLLQVADPSPQMFTKSQSAPSGRNYSNVQSSSALPSSSLPSFSASSAGSSVQKSDVSALGASYSHNFQLHVKEWVSRRRDERQVEIDALQAQQEVEEGPNPESRARVGFEMSRKLAKGEVPPPPPSSASSGSGGATGGGKGQKTNGESLRNDWDRKKGGNPHSSDERVWRTFMSKQRNRR